MSDRDEVVKLIARLRVSDPEILVTERWKQLQAAHKLSQPYWQEHTEVHLLMLVHALRTRSVSEIFVQLVFSIVSAPSSIFKLFPKDHPGTLTIDGPE